METEVKTMHNPTINELVDLFHPVYVGVTNQKGKTEGNTKVDHFTVYYEPDGIQLWVTINGN